MRCFLLAAAVLVGCAPTEPPAPPPTQRGDSAPPPVTSDGPAPEAAPEAAPETSAAPPPTYTEDAAPVTRDAPAPDAAPETTTAAPRQDLETVWTTLQTAVRTGDAAALAALQDADPEHFGPGAAPDLAGAVLEVASSWPEVREAILATPASELGFYDGRHVFGYSPPDGPQPDGFEITLREAADGRVFLTTATYIG